MRTSESTRLLASAAPLPVALARSWEFWQVGSPSFRYFLLVLLSLIPFSGHFVKNQMTSIQQLMLDDATFPITNTMFGALNSAVSAPSMVIPFLGGHMLDVQGHLSAVYFLLVMFAGHGVVTYGLATHTFWLALVGRVVFGIGEGSVVVGARAMVSHWFDTSELTFSMGVLVATTSVSKMLAKATVAPIAIYFGGYIYGLLYGSVMCMLSGAAAVLATQYIHTLTNLSALAQASPGLPPVEEPDKLAWLSKYLQVRPAHHRRTSIGIGVSTLAPLKGFPLMFWVLVIVHVVFINVFHLFQNISSSYLYQVHGYSVVSSGFVSSISHVLVLLSPVVGLWIDCLDGRIHVIVTSAILGVLAYGLLLFTTTPPVISLLLISFCLASTPAVLMACVPLTISKSCFGRAFGIVEVIDAIGSTLSNVLVGYLRDCTGDYTADMHLFFGLAWVLLGVCITLGLLDHRHGHVLSSTAHTTTATDSTTPCPVSLRARHVSLSCDDADVCVDFARTLYDTSDHEEGDDEASGVVEL
ncbi:hypothetical protein H310_00626 [Aphanomyces invadans]|uniref:Lysosomal dipeptide transporter MFSD1 n=1 Tax=Aphanomyces invadans TaxID=157072 RepID=A0A024UVA3_9STRA|nr:hypothetical protein H310_00626 [Aphanomyces invadans]ETW10284.1 hypothetical protein H310_00626 [Aphanomyces invadans]|eukprot:XP_008861695.1 hypothetical protein H310_00626 [Aphanomyces invadans]